MSRGSGLAAGLVLCGLAVAADNVGPGDSQGASNDAIGEIIVTARKQSERLIDVPVVVSALSEVTIERYSLDSLTAVAQQIPQLIINDSSTGATINLRGIGASAGNPSADQPVTVALDGVQISDADVMRIGQFDLQRVEVLKGPQTLLFGKNSPAGVVSLASNDPGDTFEAQARGGYEFYSEEKYGELIVSGPLGGGFGARLVGYYAAQEGYFEDAAVPIPGVVYPTTHDTANDQTESFGRFTLTFASPSDVFTARLKANYGRVDIAGGIVPESEIYNCPFGAPLFNTTVKNCGIGRQYVDTAVPPTLAASDPKTFGDGQPYWHEEQSLGSFEMNYTPVNSVHVTSLTGVYDLKEHLADCFTAKELCLLAAGSFIENKQYSEELRVRTSFDMPLNFLAGAYYQHNRFTETNPVAFPASIASALLGVPVPFPVETPLDNYDLRSKAWSGFGQVSYKFSDQWDLGVGARYSHEEKDLGGTTGGGTFAVPSENIASLIARPTRDFSNTSPEVTLTYKPVNDLTAYVSYRTGFISGGYNTVADAVFKQPNGNPADFSYDQTTTKGAELGFKGYVFDRRLRFDAAAYYYKYNGLQVSAFDPITTQITTTNAATALIRGIEANLVAKPEFVRGLELRSGASYNKATYGQFANAGCYGGQTIADGCNGNLVGAAYTTQNLSGANLNRAPRATFDAGFTYERGLGSNGLTGSLSMDGNYQSAYGTMLENAPGAVQGGYALVNGNLSLNGRNGDWQVSLIGRNLMNKLTITNTFGAPLTGAGSGTNMGTPEELGGTLLPPRTIILQFLVKSALLTDAR